MAAYVVLWFAVIGPGHTRGIVKLVSGQASASCCAVGVLEIKYGQGSTPGDAASSNTPASSSNKPTDPTKPTNSSGNCAICHLNATLHSPVVVEFTLPVLELLEVVSPSVPLTVDAVTVAQTYRGRAPPNHLL